MSSCLTSKRTDVAFKNENGCKGTTKFSNLQDFKQKKLSVLAQVGFCLLKILEFAPKCERSFEGFPFRVVGRRYYNFLIYANKSVILFLCRG